MISNIFLPLSMIFTLKAVLTLFKMKLLGQKWDFKYFFLYDVITLKCVISSDPPFTEWHVKCTFETFSIVSEARNARVTFVEKPQKNIQFSKWKTWIFNAILDQTKLWRVLLWIRIDFNSFFNLLVWVNPPPMSPPQRGPRRGAGGSPPPRTPLSHCP